MFARFYKYIYLKSLGPALEAARDDRHLDPFNFPNKLTRYGSDVNSHDLLKVLATICMFIDHIGYYYFPQNAYLRVIGRAAAPLFFFLVGYSAHHEFKRDIFYCGIFLTLLTAWCEKLYFFNILINFTLIKMFLQNVNPTRLTNKQLLFLFLLFVLLVPFLGAFIEYGTLGILFAIAGRLLATKDKRFIAWLNATVVVYFFQENMVFQFFMNDYMLFSFIIICFLLLMILLFYRRHIWKFPAFIRIPLLVIARYSLWIYTAHLAVFKLLLL